MEILKTRNGTETDGTYIKYKCLLNDKVVVETKNERKYFDTENEAFFFIKQNIKKFNL